ncbi:Integral membrane protein (PIN domain superfamily) (plasmid) [Legionella adelaidensis]|uniref:Integral membrane protein (PIN domain superfamily) n=1 Tax=Legionella adelaidensis TaxID=45056 RepID=A0A0W0R3M2_9GAMM|nr:hypothetical protein [Legionella adelaidensis]KTC65679.1 Integral membrane protein (PIN domain superfamily) [Legionella adelaidensis]VEH85125.1 Integral membrane protein (PIN domain superfamily) [Legionella adelaidensis]
MVGAIHTFLIGQIVGLYMVIMAIIMIARARYYRELIQDIRADSIEIFFSASVWLFIGIMLVVLHNIWVMGPPVIVTVIAWLILIKSVFWLAIPEMMLRWTRNLYSGSGFYVVAVIAAIFGVILMSSGFHPLFADLADFNPFN